VTEIRTQAERICNFIFHVYIILFLEYQTSNDL